MFRQTSAFLDWFAERNGTHRHRVTPVPLNRLDGWAADPETGNLRHRSGRFFTVEGLEVTTGRREVPSWTQPVIVQPESGLLGILVQDLGGVRHFLLQAKMEPGNVNTLQMSPTVQATRSNFTRVHRGRAVPYLEYFLAPRRGRVLSDALQSEQGAWFLRKRNRNMIVEVPAGETVPVRDGFCWLTLEQIGDLLALDNVANMDTRTVLSGLPAPWPDAAAGPGAEEHGLHTTAELLSRLTEVRAAGDLHRRRIPLHEVKGWARSGERIAHEDGRYFSVIGVDVEADGREVARWSQPMLAPAGRGVVAFLTREIGGLRHVLVQLRTEAGTFDVAELAPTVQCLPANHAHLPAARRPRFLDRVLDAPESRVLFDVVHSEEGGRFHHAENRYLAVEAGEDVPPDPGGDHVWMTPRQLGALLRHSHVNVEARNLLTCLRFLRPEGAR
ncbi:NDP-hexose 2,3-dehydratase family protein [Streptomyces sp. JJ36]|uniref:NDP-hexose 2,3-dehydratase family protein n=1 Tax=Streptomyces sp. JJ36 TaxID=2736645 RepID=UPI001F2285F9|nr:NDP-hexose 2,3-dehydratase family protein [Streptomyces sp. JJ36]MCF6525438.1 NDP-hexose 2,3-dehydratase family protein [Streptomyces sp. JJ36]